MVCLMAVYLALACASFAQIKSSTIHVVVMDETGARVEGAQIIVTEETTNQKFEGQANSVGELTVPYLAAGRYSISVKAQGFRPYAQTGLNLPNNTTVGVDAQLSLGSTQQAIEVTASGVQLQTESSSVQGSATSTLIEALPNFTGNPLAYAILQPGVYPAKAAFSSTQGVNSFGIGYTSRSAYSAISVNGGETLSADLQLDGVPINDPAYNSAAVMPNPEGIQEVRTLVNNFTAENGRGQGVMSIITKSGGNEYHGSASLRVRNEAFNANGFQNNTNKVRRPPFKSETWSAAFGGPIIKDKLFFFASYEGLAHSVGAFWLGKVPTAAEKRGDFSETMVTDQDGKPMHTQLYDPFSATEAGPNLYRRMPIPNNIIPNPNQYALKLFSYYPDPNRTPIDVYNNQNYFSSGKQTYSKAANNTKVDYRRGNRHSIYGAGGFSNGSIQIGSPWGEGNPFYTPSNVGGSQNIKDRNPYLTLGDTIVLSPTLVVDLRAGLIRIASSSRATPAENFDWNTIGVPGAVQAIMPDRTSTPDFCPGNGYMCLGNTTWAHKTMRETSEVVSGSVTKNRGRWTFKAGAEYRAGQANYEDFAQGSVEIYSGVIASEYLTATGGNVPQNALPIQSGYGAANLLQGAGSYTLLSGFGVRPALSTRYTALYTQNDWRVNSRLTINLGLRWELQPAPVERHNRVSSFDETARNPWGTLGAIAFTGTDGYDRHLWDMHYRDFGPRLGIAYSLTQSMVLRGGYGITYLPSSTGYAPGPSRYGTGAFDTSTAYQFFPLQNPAGVLAGTFDSGSTVQIIPAIGANPSAPQLYGVANGFPWFSRHGYKDGRIQQVNVAVEKRFGNNWFVSLTYSGTRGDQLPNKWVLQSDQLLPQADRDAWRNAYVASGGKNPAQDLVPNPLQPATGSLIPFGGSLASRTISRSAAMQPNLLYPGGLISISNGESRYNSAQLHVNHAFAGGFLLDAHYTWSKSMANSASDMFINGGTDTGIDGLGTNGRDFLNMNNNWHLGFVDVPHRFVASFVYDLPFGKGGGLELKNRVARLMAGGWKISGSEIIQSGMPLIVLGGTSALNQRPDRVPGVDVELPESYQHFYDGKTAVTLPSGRVFTPAANAFLKFNPDAFSGRVVKMPNGNYATDIYWWGNAALTYDDIRGPGRFNTDLTLSRSFSFGEKRELQFIANVTNAFNHTQFTTTGNLATGDPNTTTYPGRIGNLGQLGGHGLATYDPRQIELKLRFAF
jgi:hypothetical protein